MLERLQRTLWIWRPSSAKSKVIDIVDFHFIIHADSTEWNVIKWGIWKKPDIHKMINNYREQIHIPVFVSMTQTWKTASATTWTPQIWITLTFSLNVQQVYSIWGHAHNYKGTHMLKIGVLYNKPSVAVSNHLLLHKILNDNLFKW